LREGCHGRGRESLSELPAWKALAGISKNLVAQEQPLNSLQKRFGFKADSIVTAAMGLLLPAKAA
jgi:hypothetical protein